MARFCFLSDFSTLFLKVNLFQSHLLTFLGNFEPISWILLAGEWSLESNVLRVGWGSLQEWAGEWPRRASPLTKMRDDTFMQYQYLMFSGKQLGSVGRGWARKGKVFVHSFNLAVKQKGEHWYLATDNDYKQKFEAFTTHVIPLKKQTFQGKDRTAWNEGTKEPEKRRQVWVGNWVDKQQHFLLWSSWHDFTLIWKR